MTYKLDSRFMGYPAIEAVVGVPASLAALPVSPGFLVVAEDKVWGPGEFIFARAGGSIRQYGLCVLTPAWDATNLTMQQNMTECPNTANLGRPVYVCQSAGGLTVGQYGWFLDTGVTPVNGTASVAADTTAGITAAGQIGANSAGKQLVNARVMIAATQTVVKNAISGALGDTKINVKNTDGWFVGGYISGTGVPASTTITFVDPLGNYVLISAALTADAAGVAMTVTYNNATVFYNVMHMDRAFAQGAIT